MKKLILVFLLFTLIKVNGQSSFGSSSFSKPTLSPAVVDYVTSSGLSVESYVIDNGGAAINQYVIYQDNFYPPTTVVLNSPLYNIIAAYTPYRIWNFQTGLTPSTTYYFKICASNVAGQTCVEGSGSTLAAGTSIPTVQTNAASLITTSTATINGNVTSDGGSAITDRGFYYGLSNPPTTKASAGSTGTGSYSVGLGGLSSNTTYYFKAYAENTNGEAVGSILNFTTSSANTVPTVTTTTAYNITTGSALSGGNVTNDGGATVTERGIYYGTSPNPNTQYSAGGSGMGSFTTFLGYLSANTTYYYRAYAKNSYGTGYGAEYSFTTLPQGQAPTVTTNSASSITQLSATVSGTLVSSGGGTIRTYGINIYESDQTTLIANIPTTSSFSTNYTELCYNTTYYAEAYAINDYGTGVGNKVPFTTSTYPGITTGFLFSKINNISIIDSTSAVNAINSVFNNGISTSSSVSTYLYSKISAFTSGSFIYYYYTNCIYPNNNSWSVWYTGEYIQGGSKIKPLKLIHWDPTDRRKIFTITEFTF